MEFPFHVFKHLMKKETSSKEKKKFKILKIICKLSHNCVLTNMFQYQSIPFEKFKISEQVNFQLRAIMIF